MRADVVFPHHCDEAYELKYSPYHRWFYEKGMGEDDVILFKLYDNKDGVATRKCLPFRPFHRHCSEHEAEMSP